MAGEVAVPGAAQAIIAIQRDQMNWEQGSGVRFKNVIVRGTENENQEIFIREKVFYAAGIVGLLMVVLLGVTVLAYAAVTIPNSFTPNTTANARR